MKKFKLPKEFAQKWVEALRSGKYRQGKYMLSERNNSGVCDNCCLGVA